MRLPLIRLPRHPCADAGKETLHFPVAAPARLAVIDADFYRSANMRSFVAHDIRGLAGYAPEALALPLSLALSLADQKLRGLLELPSLKCAIVVFSSHEAGGPLAAHHRDLLWKAFGLPVFEQLRGWDGRVFARECEVHDGLHFDPILIPTFEDVVEVNRSVCECGNETPRLQRLLVPETRAAAAAA